MSVYCQERFDFYKNGWKCAKTFQEGMRYHYRRNKGSMDMKALTIEALIQAQSYKRKGGTDEESINLSSSLRARYLFECM